MSENINPASSIQELLSIHLKIEDELIKERDSANHAYQAQSQRLADLEAENATLLKSMGVWEIVDGLKKERDQLNLEIECLLLANRGLQETIRKGGRK